MFSNSNMFGICYNNTFITWYSYIITSRLQCSNKCIEDANATFIVVINSTGSRENLTDGMCYYHIALLAFYEDDI